MGIYITKQKVTDSMTSKVHTKLLNLHKFKSLQNVVASLLN